MEVQAQHWQRGVLLALFTTILWGTLPIALKLLEDHMDEVTLTWCRFVAAVGIVGTFLYARQALPGREILKKSTILFLLLAIGGLVTNYVVFLVGLRRITPDASQVLIQLGPMFFLLGSVFFFKERFRRVQWLGFGVLMIGLILFFHHRIEEMIARSNDEYGVGLLVIVLAAALWAGYALAQKRLMKEMGPGQILFIIYLAGTILLLPIAKPSAVFRLDGIGWGLLIFSSINTVLAYGCFAKAQHYIESSRVSAVITLTPLFTLGFSWITMRMFRDFKDVEAMDWLSWLGAILVVAGSMRTVLVRKTPESVGTSPESVYDEVSVTPEPAPTTTP